MPAGPEGESPGGMGFGLEPLPDGNDLPAVNKKGPERSIRPDP